MSTELNKHIQKLKDMGVTISIQTHDGQEPQGISAVMKKAATDAGIYYEKGAAPTLSKQEQAEVTRFGIHEEDQEDEK